MDPQVDVRTSGHLQDSCGIWFYSHKGADRGPPAGFLPSYRRLPLFWCPGALLQAVHTAGRDSGHRLLDRGCLVIDCPCSGLLALASSAPALFFSKAVTCVGTPDQTVARRSPPLLHCSIRINHPASLHLPPGLRAASQDTTPAEPGLSLNNKALIGNDVVLGNNTTRSFSLFHRHTAVVASRTRSTEIKEMPTRKTR